MTAIDDKVVSMSFEGSKFEAGVANTLTALDRLKNALKFDGATRGLDDISKSAQNVQLGHIGQAVDDIKGKFSALGVTAIAIMASIATKALSAGAAFVKSFTLGPILQGFQEYSTTLNSVQTILANTQASGATLGDVNKALQDLNTYSDKTIYNFSQMARNIGTFTAAGVDLKTSTEAIKGIANLAALSGSNADQASTAMYQLSQAIAAGQVHLQDWNSVVNAGMGGTVFQRALATTAENMGRIKKGSLELVGPMKNVKIAGESFRQSLVSKGGKSWLTSDVLTATLKQFTGDLTDAQLKAEGFTASQIKAIQQTAKTAQHAATEVKTISQVFDVAKETLGSGWAQTFQIIFGTFTEAKSTFTALSNTINGFINASAKARNKVLGDWKALGGRTVLLKSIGELFTNLGMILKPIREAFRDIFPATTGKNLLKLTYEFKHFTEALKPGPATIENLKRTFAGLFALLDIGKQIIGGVFTMFGKMFGAVGDSSGGFLKITGSIGDFLVKVDEALKKGNTLHNFFAGLGSVLSAPTHLLIAIEHALSGLFSGFSPGGFSGQISGITKGLSPLHAIIKTISTAWNNMLDSISNSGGTLQPIFDAIHNFFAGLSAAIGGAASGMNFESILAAIRTGLLGGLFLIFKNFMHQITGGFLGGGIIKNISSTFQSLSNSMQSLQHNIQAKTLKEIAIAIALLVLSVVALSFVNPDKLKSAIIAMGFMFAELLIAMKIMNQITKGLGFAKLPIIAASLILLATAIDLLTISVLAMSRLSWNELLKGLAGVGVLLGVLSAASIVLSANSGGMIRAGIGITAMAIGIRILANAVAAFSGMSWTELGKGLGAVALSLVAIAGGMQLMPSGMAAKGVGLLIIASSLKILSGVVTTFGNMNWSVMEKGLAGVGGALLVIAAAMQVMPKNMILTAAGLLLVSVALGKITNAVVKMGGMTIGEIAKGLGTLAGALGILAIALTAMSGTLGGAAALMIAAAGIALLTPALIALGKMSWGQILKGLATLAAALTLIGIAGALITPVIPSLLGLGVALVLIGGGLALAGAGIALIGIGLSALVVAAPTGVAILITALEQLIAAIPELVKSAVVALLAIVNGLAASAPKFVDAVLKILNSLLDAVIKSAPKMALAFDALLTVALSVLKTNEPKLIQAGFDLLLALLTGIRNNIGPLVKMGVDIVVKFIGAIASSIGKIIAAGAGILVAVLKGIGNGISGVATAALNILTKFLGAIANGLGRVVIAGLSILTKLLAGIASGLGNAIKAGGDVIVKFITGIGNVANRVVTAGSNVIIKFINGLGKNAVDIANAAGKAIVTFLNGLTAAVNTYAPQIRAATRSLGFALIDGITGGMLSKAQDLYNKVGGIMHHALGLFHSIPGVHSPSTVTIEIGKNLILGLSQGMDEAAPELYDSVAKVSKETLAKFNAVFKIGLGTGSGAMYEIGQLVSSSFAQGIRGSTDDITSAFSDLNTKLTDSMKTARETIASEQDKLKKLREADKPDAAAIKAAQKTIDENQKILERSTIIHNTLITTLKHQGVELLQLSVRYDDLTTRLEAAKTKLDELKQARDDAITSTTDQYAAAPDLVGPSTGELADMRANIATEQTKLDAVLKDSTSTAEQIAAARASVTTEQAKLDAFMVGKVLDASGTSIDVVATYLQALKTQGDAVGAYSATLDQLRKLGLDDETYQKLLTEGTADQSFASQLLAGGKTAVDSLNTLDTSLQNVSKRLATKAAKNLKQAGIDAAQGLIDGLKAKRGEIRGEMEAIAREMIAALKKELKQKSPSEEFASIGRFSMQGLANGLSNSSKIVTDAVKAAANDALSEMKRSMSNISDIVTGELDTTPVITPILDLTQVQTKAQELAALTNALPITAAASFGQAVAISSEQTALQAGDIAAGAIGPTVKFEQNNYSPEALTEIEIYRHTRNQLSQLKSVLAL